MKSETQGETQVNGFTVHPYIMPDLGSNLWLEDSILRLSVLVVFVISFMTEGSVSLIGLLVTMAKPLWPLEGNVAAF